MSSERIAKNAQFITVEECSTYMNMIKNMLKDKNVCEPDEAKIKEICLSGLSSLLDTDEDVSDPNYRSDYMLGYTEGYCDHILGIPPKYPIE